MKRRKPGKPDTRQSSNPSSRTGETDRSPPDTGGSGFSFVDRSGKAHTIAPHRKGQHAANHTDSPRPKHVERLEQRAQKNSVPLPHELPRMLPSLKAQKKSEHKKGAYGNTHKANPFERPARPERGDHGGGRAERPMRKEIFRHNEEQRPKGDASWRPKEIAQSKQRIVKAIVDKNKRGFAFLGFEDRRREDAFVPPHEASQLFHGDRVEVELSHRGEILDIRVLEHRFREIFGRYSPHPGGRGGYVIYERKRAREEVYTPDNKIGAKSGDWVRAKIEFAEGGHGGPTAELIATFGDTLPASIDVEMIAAEYNLTEAHPPEAEKEAREFKLEITPELLADREDLRKVPFITIDGETARDFDDAVYVERKGSGFILWVAIADVSHYVKPGTALDDDARSRGTSVYFPERAFHMLPRALSETLCSLKPHEPRLTMVSKLEFDKHGTHIATELFEALIQSQRRATYNEIEAEWKENKTNKSWQYADHFALYHLLRDKRRARGSVDFDLPEAEVVVDAKGEPIRISVRDRLDAHRLIEEFMIAANESVTEWMLSLKDPGPWPFVYRVHDEPALASIEKFTALAATMGVPLALSSKGGIHQQLARFIEHIAGHPAQALLNQQLLRSMKQAIYSATHGEHFGLASTAYTHFTSPIRRYPDLIVHRMLRWALRVINGKEPKPTLAQLKDVQTELEELVEHCSYRERLAAEADREANRLKQTRMMLKHLGEEFDGKITGITDTGLFVTLKEPYCEGLVNKESITDDMYEFKEDKMILLGRRTRRQFKIGEDIEVRVLAADLDRRQTDYGLAEQTDEETPRINRPIDIESGQRGRRGHPGRGESRDREQRSQSGERGASAEYSGRGGARGHRSDAKRDGKFSGGGFGGKRRGKGGGKGGGGKGGKRKGRRK